MEAKRQLTRITADFSPEAYETLSNVTENLKTTKADALRKALGLLSFVLDQQDKGWRLVLENENGAKKEIVTL